jgi:autoinducer 2-degrading protein
MELMHIQMTVKADCIEAFMRATKSAAEATRAEPGCLRFDVMQSLQDPTIFVLVEAYTSGATKDIHLQSPHFAAWQEEIADLVEHCGVIGCRPIHPRSGHW